MGAAQSDNNSVHWVFTRHDQLCRLETSYDPDGHRYLATMHTPNGSTDTECFRDPDLFNMFLARMESALERAGWQPAVPNRPLYMPEFSGTQPDLVH